MRIPIPSLTSSAPVFLCKMWSRYAVFQPATGMFFLLNFKLYLMYKRIVSLHYITSLEQSTSFRTIQHFNIINNLFNL